MKRHAWKFSLLTFFIALPMFFLTQSADAARKFRFKQYAVTVTNLTASQSFTDLLVVSHRPGMNLFSLGGAASEGLEDLAEGGQTDALIAELKKTRRVLGAVVSVGLLGPGESKTVLVPASGLYRQISVAAMLLPTNDAFVSIMNVGIPKGRRTVSVEAKAYDAGTEMNDELCASIPGPDCGGEGTNLAEDGEGFVHIHSGIHGVGDLSAAEKDWNNPVASFSIKRK